MAPAANAAIHQPSQHLDGCFQLLQETESAAGSETLPKSPQNRAHRQVSRCDVNVVLVGSAAFLLYGLVVCSHWC